MSTFGRTTTTTYLDDCYINYIRGGKFTLSENGVVASITAYLSCDSGGSGTWKGAIYSDNSGNPNALQGTTVEATIGAGSSLAKRTATFSTPVALTAGTYWLMVHTGSSGYVNIARSASGGVGIYAIDTYVGGALDPFNASHTHTDSYYCIYATYTAGSVPAAPTLVSPVSNADIEATNPQVFKWTPDGAQSGYQLRYKVSGAASWTTLTAVVSAYPQATIAGATFTAGSTYEWACRTANTTGYGAWSTSGFFDAVTGPDQCVITAPANGETVSTNPYSITWTATDQDDFQARRVADNAGAPDTGTIYEDSGTVSEAATRAYAFTLTVDGRAEHWQVRTRYSSIWSSWSSVAITTGYTPPQTPTLTIVAHSADGYIGITADEPAPSGTPTVLWEDIYVSEAADGTGAIRIGTHNTPEAEFKDYSPTADVNYYYMVRAVGDTGATADSAWTG